MSPTLGGMTIYRTIVQTDDGSEYELTPGHDSWVIGDEPYVSRHIMGSEEYAAAK